MGKIPQTTKENNKNYRLIRNLILCGKPFKSNKSEQKDSTKLSKEILMNLELLI